MNKFILILFLIGISRSARAQYQEGLDPTFGSKGISMFGSGDILHGALQADGKIIALSIKGPIRFKADGTIDSSFNVDGVYDEPVYDDKGAKIIGVIYNAVAVQPDGKTIILGTDIVGGSVFLIRLGKDGYPDISFGGGLGMVYATTAGYNSGNSLVIQPDGKIVVLGATRPDNYQVLARYHSDGRIDSSFGTYGKVVNTRAEIIGLMPNSLILMPDGRILAFYDDFGVARYLPDGKLDTTFNHRGMNSVFSPSLGGPVTTAIALRPDNKIWIAGYPLFGSPTPFMLARLNADGSIDSSLNGKGYVVYDWEAGDENKCRDILLQPDGKVILGGPVWNHATGMYLFALMRVLPDGAEDGSFGDKGRRLTAPNGADELGTDMFKLLLQPDNKILALGISSTKASSPATIARYQPDGKAGIPEEKYPNRGGIYLYPNPTRSVLHISNTTHSRIESIRIYTLTGVLVHEFSNPPGNTIDLGNLPAACYIAVISTDDNHLYRQTIFRTD